MSDLVDFLLARIAEDEAAAQGVGSFTPWDEAFQIDNYGHMTIQPGRILAECEAKRRIVEAARDYSPELSQGDNGEWAFDFMLRALALPYADHTDFNPAWANA